MYKNHINKIHFIILLTLSSLCGQAQCLDTASLYKYDLPSEYSVRSQITLNSGNVLLSAFSNADLSNKTARSIFINLKNGIPQWAKKLLLQRSSDGLFIHHIVDGGNGASIAAGVYKSADMQGAREFLFICKVDEDGNLLWQKVFDCDISIGENQLFVQSLTMDSQTGRIYASLHNGDEFNVVCLSPIGNVIWNQSIDLFFQGFPNKAEIQSYWALQLVNGQLHVFIDAVHDIAFTRILIEHLALSANDGTLIGSNIYDRQLVSPATSFGNTLFNLSSTLTSKHIILYGNPADGSTRAMVAKFDFDGNFNGGRNFIPLPQHFTLYQTVPKIFVTPDERIVTLIVGKNANQNNLYYTLYDTAFKVVQQQQIFLNGRNGNNGSSFNNISYDKRNGNINVIANYSNNTEYFSDLYKVFTGQQSTLSCFGSEGLKDSSSPLGLTPLDNYYTTNSQLNYTEINVNVTLQDQTIPSTEICTQISDCNAIKVLGQDSICTTSDTMIYTARRNKDCLQGVKWKVDSSTFSYFSVEKDTILKIIFKPGFNGKLYAELAGCKIKDSISVTVFPALQTFSVGPDRVLCTKDTVRLDATAGYKNYKWSDGSTSRSLRVGKPGVYVCEGVNFCNDRFKDTVKISASLFILRAGKDASICLGDTLLLKATAGLNNYKWLPQLNLSTPLQAQTTALLQADTDLLVSASAPDGCQLKDSIHITVNTSPQIILVTPNNICQGDSALLNVGSVFNSYLWNTGETTPTIFAKKTGQYSVKTIYKNGCAASASTYLMAVDTPKAFLPKKIQFCAAEKVILSSQQNFENYLWNTGSTNKSIKVSKSGIYKLKATNIDGCSGQDRITVTEKDCRKLLFFPSAFSPNQDGVNDYFRPLNIGTPVLYQFKIFNRYGQLIFSSSDVAKVWDGTFKGSQQSTGSYTWFCTYQFQGLEEQFAKGFVTLLR